MGGGVGGVGGTCGGSTGFFTVVLILHLSAITVVILRALDRVCGRALGWLGS